MIDLDNQTTSFVDIQPLETIKQSICHYPLELLIVDDKQIQQLNAHYRNKNVPTDVLSFPLSRQFSHESIGSIVISMDTALKAAKQYNHSPEEELALLFIHGLLHLMGYDHENDQGEHRLKEQELIERFNLPPSLIIRSQ